MKRRRRPTASDPLPPEESEYWERLAGRIDSAVLQHHRHTTIGLLGAHGVRVGGAGVAAAALLLAWALTQSAPAPGGATRDPGWRQTLAPSDSLGRTLAVDQPPALGAFILAGSRTGSGVTSERRP